MAKANTVNICHNFRKDEFLRIITKEDIIKNSMESIIENIQQNKNNEFI